MPSDEKQTNYRKLTPEQEANSKETREMLSRAISKGLAQDNLEIFGTPIPPEVQDYILCVL
jgi:hypothetical protein